MKQILILLIILIICVSYRQKERKNVEASDISIDHVSATVTAKIAQDINESPLFSFLWESSSGSPVKPTDFLIGSIVSRIPSRDLFTTLGSKSKNRLKILNPETGLEIANAIIPESILQNHRTLYDSPGLPGHFKYATCRNQEDTFLLVQATQKKHSGTRNNRHGSGIGTALYCCTMEGTILWTFLGKLTHSVVIATSKQSDVIVITQGSSQIVLLSVKGKEIGRINTPTFNAIEIREDNEGGGIKLHILSDKIYCYALSDSLLNQ